MSEAGLTYYKITYSNPVDERTWITRSAGGPDGTNRQEAEKEFYRLRAEIGGRVTYRPTRILLLANQAGKEEVLIEAEVSQTCLRNRDYYLRRMHAEANRRQAMPEHLL